MAASIVRDINRKVILGLKSKLPSYIECQFYRSISQCTSNSQKSLRYYGQPTPSTHPHLLKKGEVTPGLDYEEYQMRRHKLMESIASYSAKSNPKHDHHLVIIPSASKTFMSEKIPYVFHQNTNFSYTTGFQEPNSALVLHSVPGKLLPFHISTLFVPRRDPHTELWDGPRTGSDRAVELTGVDEAMDFEQLEYFLDMFLSTNNKFTLWYDFSSVPNSDINRIMKHFIKKCRQQSNISFDNPLYLIQQLRVIKSPSEIKLLQQSCNIASDAFSEVMQFSHPNVSEHVLNAKMEFECKLRGAQYLGYPPVVAGGNRANIIHYINNNQWILEDELILMDAGCYYGNYVSDITRTWPVNGRFTSSQLAVYEAVLEVQEELIKLCNVTSSLDSLFSVLCLSIAKKLQQLGIASQNISSADLIQVAQKFCPHHVGHYLGMDVHDTAMISRSAKLKPGMVITIEPGIYINEKNHKVPEKFHGIGVRIEDNILITDSEPVLLTKKCPKSVHDIETLLHSRISQEVTGR